MKIHQGRLFGELLIGTGIAYLIHMKTGNLLLAIAAGVGFGVADYLILTLTDRFKKK